MIALISKELDSFWMTKIPTRPDRAAELVELWAGTPKIYGIPPWSGTFFGLSCVDSTNQLVAEVALFKHLFRYVLGSSKRSNCF